jgi:nucleotide-binding universal stress UspA family protein
VREVAVGRIVVGVDGSEGADEALRFALREARVRQARLRVVTVWSVPAFVYNEVIFTPLGDPMEPFRAAAEENLREALARVADDAAGVEIDAGIREGRTASVLVEEARGADLLVVGSRGRGGFAGLLLGSVSSECAHHAPCPVAIVHKATRDE